MALICPLGDHKEASSVWGEGNLSSLRDLSTLAPSSQAPLITVGSYRSPGTCPFCLELPSPPSSHG